MEKTNSCPLCKKEFEGALETVASIIGRIVTTGIRETSDCNWTNCKHCKRVICKQCYRGQQSHCCDRSFAAIRTERTAERLDIITADHRHKGKAA